MMGLWMMPRQAVSYMAWRGADAVVLKNESDKRVFV
jgi:hypothetical protein